jgi:hypothetical protein
VCHDFLDQLLFPCEVVGDDAFADPGPLGDLRQRRLRIAQGGDGVDGALDDLRPPCSLNE